MGTGIYPTPCPSGFRTVSVGFCQNGRQVRHCKWDSVRIPWRAHEIPPHQGGSWSISRAAHGHPLGRPRRSCRTMPRSCPWSRSGKKPSRTASHRAGGLVRPRPFSQYDCQGDRFRFLRGSGLGFCFSERDRGRGAKSQHCPSVELGIGMEGTQVGEVGSGNAVVPERQDASEGFCWPNCKSSVLQLHYCILRQRPEGPAPRPESRPAYTPRRECLLQARARRIGRKLGETGL